MSYGGQYIMKFKPVTKAYHFEYVARNYHDYVNGN